MNASHICGCEEVEGGARRAVCRSERTARHACIALCASVHWGFVKAVAKACVPQGIRGQCAWQKGGREHWNVQVWTVRDETHIIQYTEHKRAQHKLLRQPTPSQRPTAPTIRHEEEEEIPPPPSTLAAATPHTRAYHSAVETPTKPLPKNSTKAYANIGTAPSPPSPEPTTLSLPTNCHSTRAAWECKDSVLIHSTQYPSINPPTKKCGQERQRPGDTPPHPTLLRSPMKHNTNKVPEFNAPPPSRHTDAQQPPPTQTMGQPTHTAHTRHSPIKRALPVSIPLSTDTGA